MKLGMIVRADFGRGLANQTYSFYKHLKPDVTVVVDMSRIDVREQWPQDLDSYPDAIQTTWGGFMEPFDNPDAYEALRDCDVVYSAETPYDPKVSDLNLVLHVNPELFPDYKAKQYWYPTTWMLDTLPAGEVVPTPIDDWDIARDIPHSSKLLHVGGHGASGDRNGARIVHGLLQRIKHPIRLQSQDGMKLNPRVMGYAEPMGYQDNRWNMYEGCGILVYPRRYGGQSLQVNEAMARGLAVVMPDCPPNVETWPIVPVPSRARGRVKTQGGLIPSALVDTHELIDTIDALIKDPETLERWQWKSLAWARDNAWSEQQARIEALLGR